MPNDHDDDLDAELTRLLDDEARLQFQRFTNDDAIELGLALVATARAEHANVTIDIRRGGQQLFHAALEGTATDNDHWVVRKANVVDRFGHSSLYIGTLCRSRGQSVGDAFLVDERQYAAHGGAFPIIVEGVGVVGTATVSGLPQREDHRMVVSTIERFLAGAQQTRRLASNAGSSSPGR
jgi:uncharacterized protein (UPF0303 family)